LNAGDGRRCRQDGGGIDGEEERALAADLLELAAKRAKRRPRNVIVVTQLLFEIARHVTEGHQHHARFASMFARGRVGIQLTLLEIDGLATIAKHHSTILRAVMEQDVPSPG
jgi:hypothetical protein